MRQVLCIVSSSEEALTKESISAQGAQPDCVVKVMELGDTADYEKLLDAILEADSVQVW